MTKEQEEAMNTLAGIIRDSGFLPITRTEDRRKQLLVIDVNAIPSEMKGETEDIVTIRDTYKEMYPDYDFLFINTSRQNMEGNVTNHPPVYVI